MGSERPLIETLRLKWLETVVVTLLGSTAKVAVIAEAGRVRPITQSVTSRDESMRLLNFKKFTFIFSVHNSI